MRRGIGVSHVQQQRQTKQQMAELGAQITAERVGHIADQLETLEKHLRELMHKHEKEIKSDPVVRARFRQIADSIGVDLISSNTNIFSGALGLGNFYYDLAAKLVEACMKERKFCGSYVPLKKVIQTVQRIYDRQAEFSSAPEKDRVRISEGDVITSLKKLRCLGSGYHIVTLSGVSYVQTTPDGVSGGDVVELVNFALEQQNARRDALRRGPSAAPETPRSPATASSVSSPIGAAYVLGTHPFSTPSTTSTEAGIPRIRECLSLTLEQVAGGLGWPPHRAYAALRRSVRDGSVWVDFPTRPRASQETKSKEKRGSVQTLDDGAVYWFVSLTIYGEKIG
ncbi:unnamed protein product [Phytomonas sp. EM1]|nr:unnamed protein product [Phytomonas sp. EM1]|eukprot:CCW60592.1 unnamed protein product [Phytomonas sp. isolate EM1]